MLQNPGLSLSEADLTCLRRFIVAATQNKVVMLLSLLGPVTLAGTLGSPVITIGIKRYTTEVSPPPRPL